MNARRGRWQGVKARIIKLSLHHLSMPKASSKKKKKSFYAQHSDSTFFHEKGKEKKKNEYF